MILTIGNTESELAETIDEITNAKAVIGLDNHDFADILQDNGDLYIIKAEEAVDTSDHFSELCNTARDKLTEIIVGNKINSLIFFLSYRTDYPMMMADMNNVENIFSCFDINDVSVKWGIGTNYDKTFKLTIVMKVNNML